MQGSCKTRDYGGDIVKIDIKINDKNKSFEISGNETLYDILKKLGFTSLRKSCDTGVCGVCTVLLDGKPVPSCTYLAAKADGHNVTTIEGIEVEAGKLGKYMLEEGAVQCGFCAPGFVLTVVSMKNNLINPDDDEIKNYLSGNLCRCSGYAGQIRAIKRYLGVSQ